ncbi:winged helix DNA-binding protein [Streptomyces sp. NPDC005728]|uniref:MarR family winged helix-turn-helix transcriptional regulator n=1 Tax=Streptomyces sp. NPDC005728 TaxID=3157054 RepID=UPI0034097569
MERSVVTGTAQDPSGLRFAVIGLSNTPTDWAQVLHALNSELTLDALTVQDGGTVRAGRRAEGPPHEGGDDRSEVLGPPRLSTTPPSVLDLNAYLVYAMGKAARRRLSEKLTARGLRLWHLTAMAMLADLGPQPKSTLASRLDMNASDLVKIVNDLVKAGHAECLRQPGDRRRVYVRLTPEGRSALDLLNADIASADDDLLAPLSEEERDQLGSLLRRVHAHLTPATSSVVQEERT